MIQIRPLGAVMVQAASMKDSPWLCFALVRQATCAD
jgi:hypothetical protein